MGGFGKRIAIQRRTSAEEIESLKARVAELGREKGELLTNLRHAESAVAAGDAYIDRVVGLLRELAYAVHREERSEFVAVIVGRALETLDSPGGRLGVTVDPITRREAGVPSAAASIVDLRQRARTASKQIKEVEEERDALRREVAGLRTQLEERDAALGRSYSSGKELRVRLDVLEEERRQIRAMLLSEAEALFAVADASRTAATTIRAEYERLA